MKANIKTRNVCLLGFSHENIREGDKSVKLVKENYGMHRQDKDLETVPSFYISITYLFRTFSPEIHIRLSTFIDVVEENGVEILVVNLLGGEGKVECCICLGDLKGGWQIGG